MNRSRCILIRSLHNVALAAVLSHVAGVWSTKAEAHEAELNHSKIGKVAVATEAPKEIKPGTLPGPASYLIQFDPLAEFDLGEDLKGMEGRNARVRYWIMPPGGIIGDHTHTDRPAYVYLLEGEVVETKKGKDGKPEVNIIKKGEVALEANGTNHWWINQTKGMVRMVAVDIPNTNLLEAPKDPANVKTDELGSHDLKTQFPNIPEVTDYQMRGRRLTLNPGEKTPLQSSKGRPCITYVIEGNALEHRSDGNPVIRQGGDSSIAKGGVAYYWENPTSNPLVLFVVDFVKNSEAKATK